MEYEINQEVLCDYCKADESLSKGMQLCEGLACTAAREKYLDEYHIELKDVTFNDLHLNDNLYILSGNEIKK